MVKSGAKSVVFCRHGLPRPKILPVMKKIFRKTASLLLFAVSNPGAEEYDANRFRFIDSIGFCPEFLTNLTFDPLCVLMSSRAFDED